MFLPVCIKNYITIIMIVSSRITDKEVISLSEKPDFSGTIFLDMNEVSYYH